jgi:hypothetical protein
MLGHSFTADECDNFVAVKWKTEMSSTEGTRRRRGSFVTRHPSLTLAVVALIGLLLVALSAELALRIFGTVRIDFYTGHSSPGIHKYPYGSIPINRDGSPDEEFIPIASKKRIGYFGDSVTYGVGAGYGYRVPDLLQNAFPAHQHWVFAQVAAVPTVRQILREVAKHRLSSVIYLMNLNDILPDEPSPGAADARGKVFISLSDLASPLQPVDDALRGKSYLYTYIRLGLKNALQRAGYEVHGQLAYELRPRQHQIVIAQTASRVVELARAVTAQGVKLCVVILPYEMQVSSDAAQTYAQLGFSWEDGFLGGTTQEALLQVLRGSQAKVFDARYAFNGMHLKVGEAFVYDKGDKIDWNHPNRFGHARIAAWLAGEPEFREQCVPD